jgi:hypothetical protein
VVTADVVSVGMLTVGVLVTVGVITTTYCAYCCVESSIKIAADMVAAVVVAQTVW